MKTQSAQYLFSVATISTTEVKNVENMTHKFVLCSQQDLDLLQAEADLHAKEVADLMGNPKLGDATKARQLADIYNPMIGCELIGIVYDGVRVQHVNFSPNPTERDLLAQYKTANRVSFVAEWLR